MARKCLNLLVHLISGPDAGPFSVVQCCTAAAKMPSASFVPAHLFCQVPCFTVYCTYGLPHLTSPETTLLRCMGQGCTVAADQELPVRGSYWEMSERLFLHRAFRQQHGRQEMQCFPCQRCARCPPGGNHYLCSNPRLRQTNRAEQMNCTQGRSQVGLTDYVIAPCCQKGKSHFK